MNLRFVIIDEPIHIYDPIACDLWRRALWAKELGYRQEYRTSILPMSTDDFFATHLIVAEEFSCGRFEPVVMYKSVRRSQCRRFQVPFPAETLIKGTAVEGSPRLACELESPEEISYDSSWSVNPDYKWRRECRGILRDYVTTMGIQFHETFGFRRWLTAGVCRFKIDRYFEWVGCREIIGRFSLPIIDNDQVRMFAHDGGDTYSAAAKEVAARLRQEWERRLVFRPDPAIQNRTEGVHPEEAA